MSDKPLKILSYIVDGRLGGRKPESAEWAAKAIDEGVDVISGQGTGMDAGAYFLGADKVLPLRRVDFEPLLLAAKRTGTPFVFSMGGAAGADVHLQQYLDVVDEICKDNGIKIRIAKISGEIDREYLRGKVREGAKIRRSIDSERISEYLTEEDVDRCARVQAQLGPEPIMKALDENDDIDGVITGRALDVGIHMASPLRHGIDRSTSAHLAKIIECASMSAEPTGPFEAVVAEVEKGSFTVRCVNPNHTCTVRSVSSHSLYERENPFEERNPGGLLDVGEAVYEQIDPETVRCSGGIWRDLPYTVKLEGAEQIGYQTGTLCAIRDPAMIAEIDLVMEQARETVLAESPVDGVDVSFKVLGRDSVLGTSEPLRETATPHELGLLCVVTAPTQEIANTLANTARLRVFFAQFKGRRSTAGNTAAPLQQMEFPLGEAYVFNIWHLLPLDDPSEPFPYEIVELG